MTTSIRIARSSVFEFSRDSGMEGWVCGRSLIRGTYNFDAIQHMCGRKHCEGDTT